MARHQGQPDLRLLVWILLVSVLVQYVTCKSPNVKRTSSGCHCHKDNGKCITKFDGGKECQCKEGYEGRMCEYDCRQATENKCRSLRTWSICGKHWNWMQACCKETCEGIDNTCLNANPLECKRWESRGECKRNPKYMTTCCGLCFGKNPKCKG